MDVDFFLSFQKKLLEVFQAVIILLPMMLIFDYFSYILLSHVSFCNSNFLFPINFFFLFISPLQNLWFKRNDKQQLYHSAFMVFKRSYFLFSQVFIFFNYYLPFHYFNKIPISSWLLIAFACLHFFILILFLSCLSFYQHSWFPVFTYLLTAISS